MTFFELRGEAPWGDYGSVLIAGEELDPSSNGVSRLRRTGPFMPPVTFPDRMFVSDAFKSSLAHRFSFLTYREAEKSHIVEIRWENWDRDADLPLYPPGGEPENYLLQNPHSEAAALGLGRVWEVICPEGPLCQHVMVSKTRSVKVFELNQWNGSELFLSIVNGMRCYIVSDSARSWFASQVGQWVYFNQVFAEDELHHVPRWCDREVPSSSPSREGEPMTDLLAKIKRGFSGLD